MPKKNKYSTQKDLTKALRKNLKIDMDQSKKIIDEYFNKIKTHLLEGSDVKLPEFGQFNPKDWNMEHLYDVNTGQKVPKKIKTVNFKISPVARDQIVRS